MFHRRPYALNQLSDNASASLARLSAIEGFSRALLVGIVPLVAFEILGSKERVSLVYLMAAILTVMVTLNISTLERILKRRRVVTLGGLFLIAAATFLFMQNSTLLSLGIGLRSAAASLFSVCLSLYIMDYIGKREFTRNESLRMQYAGIAWLVGPYLGITLYDKYAEFAPFLLSATAAFAMLTYFWYLHFSDDKVVIKAKSTAANPWKSVVRYSSQKRLRIAYGITLSRSCFWVVLFVYGPIYVIESGLPAWVAGLLLSGISALLFLSPVVRYFADKYGTRQVLIVGLIITGSSLIALGLIGTAQPIGIVFWVFGALGGVLLDVLGNIPFMRSVRPRERLAMTAVFSTWREGSELLTPALVSLVLLFAPFYFVYYILAIMHFMAAVKASYLPARL